MCGTIPAYVNRTVVWKLFAFAPINHPRPVRWGFSFYMAKKPYLVPDRNPAKCELRDVIHTPLLVIQMLSAIFGIDMPFQSIVGCNQLKFMLKFPFIR
jgi:hypothetical protein